MKSYREIDVNKTLVVILSYSHFFMVESLNRILGISEVYKINRYRESTRLKDMSRDLA